MSATADYVLAGELAVEATSLHLLGQYDASLQTLQRLEGQLLEDPSVQHNLCLASWYADAGTGVNALAGQLKAFMEASWKQDSGASSRSASAVAAINCASLLYVQQQHAKALQILQPLFHSVETMHGGAAMCLCVLLLEIYLGSNQHVKAAQVLHYLQASLAPEVPLRMAMENEQVDTDAVTDHSDTQHESPKPRSQQSAAPPQSPKQLRPPQQPKQQRSPRPPHEHLLSLQQQQQQLEELQLPVSTNMPLVSRLTSSNMQQVYQVVTAHGGVLLGVDMPAVLHLYKARLAMACSNFKAAKKEVRSLLSLCPDNPAGVLLKCGLEVLKQQPRKALKTLTPLLAAPGTCTAREKLQLLNLLSAVHQQLGKHHAAALYLTTALEQQQHMYHLQQAGMKGRVQVQQQQQYSRQQQDQEQQQQLIQAAQASAHMPMHEQQCTCNGCSAVVGSQSRHWLVPDESGALQYNLGLQQLLLGSWQPALECFEAASSSCYNWCSLWLRLAESSLSLYHQQQQQQQQQHSDRLVGEQQQRQQPGQPGDLGAAAAAADGGECASSNDCVLGAGDSLALLEQAAQQLSTGLALLQQQQAEAAKQAEAAAAALAAAAASGGQPASVEHSQHANTSSHFLATELHGDTERPADSVAISTPAIAGAGSSVTAGTLADSAGVAGASSMVEACLIPSELSFMQQALLANKAYVQLLLHNPSEALAAAQALLACSSSSSHYHHLGSCYAAEALLLLGRPEEATEQLQGQLSLPVVNSDSSRKAAGAGDPVRRQLDPLDSSLSGIYSQGDSRRSPLEHARSSTEADAPARLAESFSTPATDLRAQTSSPVQSQAALLANLSSVMAAQGNYEGSMRWASAAVAADPAVTCNADVVLLRVQRV